jgi:hypothetical protein
MGRLTFEWQIKKYLNNSSLFTLAGKCIVLWIIIKNNKHPPFVVIIFITFRLSISQYDENPTWWDGRK